MKRILENLGRFHDVAFVLFFGIIVALLIIPLPTVLIDGLIGVNMALAVMIMVAALYLRSVLDLSTFPAIVLLTTLLRLAISVATTRLILAEGDAGHIITAFGNFVVEGNVIVGLVIFLIVALVQFIVITKGAERIAEVTARFTLDAMPGKQMSIDADVRAGTCTPEDARARRFKLEKESQFFGSMDGAMRFVKGDAIAGLVIIIVNLIGGMLVGMLQKNMSAGEALKKYSLLTVGDGLIAQIPSMFIAVAAGIVVTRVMKEDAQDVGRDIAEQLAKQARPLMIAAVFCIALSLIPGFPTLVFLVLAAIFMAAAGAIFTRNGGQIPLLSKPVAVSQDGPVSDGKDEFIAPIAAHGQGGDSGSIVGYVYDQTGNPSAG
ncbi:MAG: FHIPEP family type III secretion protein [Phyllobacteriaceae bacterium]|nr:FHIPEP family type III secretion protein [Phyllobacteriaceae bacterium]